MVKEFERNTFFKRLKSMLCVDFRRMLTTPLFYLTVATCFIIPIIILVMTTMMDGTESVNQQTGEVTIIEGFKSVWEIISTVPKDANTEGAGMGMDMSLTSMCNINLLYFGLSLFVCMFISADFRSGYSKNLFSVRAGKSDYVISKTITCFFAGAVMIIAFFVGSIIGGAIMGLPFDPIEVGASIGGIIWCLLSKIGVVLVFVPIYVILSIITKQRGWLAVLISLVAGMLLFAMIPMITPLNATIVHAGLTIGGGLLFSVGLGALSTLLLKKLPLV